MSYCFGSAGAASATSSRPAADACRPGIRDPGRARRRPAAADSWNLFPDPAACRVSGYPCSLCELLFSDELVARLEDYKLFLEKVNPERERQNTGENLRRC